MSVKLLNTPKEWKVRQYRWRCPCCGTEGWNRRQEVPQHARQDGRDCKAWDKRRIAHKVECFRCNDNPLICDCGNLA